MTHIPVLLTDVLDYLIPDGRPPARVIDGTLGAGGHTKALLDAGVGHVLALDLDPQALALARAALAPYGDRCTIQHGSYEFMKDSAAQIGWQDGVDAILLDLGVSSMQVDTPERGFAFMHDGPLDMRFDPGAGGHTAADIVNYTPVEDLADLFYAYGEERDSRRLARMIVKQRPFTTTRQLADAIKAAVRVEPGKKTIHPATRIFQALRIAVNDELNVIDRVLPDAIDLLRPGGRLAVITFHSLEDRMVKMLFKEASTAIESPPGMMLEERAAEVRLVTRKPLVAGEAEVDANPRSRSAKLRVVEKI